MSALLERTDQTAPRRPARPEAPRVLAEPAPRVLTARDQAGLWASLGVTLTLPAVAGYVYDGSSGVASAATAVVVGSALGAVLLGLAAVVGARVGQPAMVVLRGLLGARGSLLPTALNVVQCLGWTVVEVSVIALGGHGAVPAVPFTAWAVGGGVLATLLALRPLGSVRLLRRGALVVVLVASAYLLVRALQRPLTAYSGAGWSGFGAALDTVLAIPVSWVPLVADHSRHSTSARAAFVGTAGGFGVACAAYFGLGVVAVAGAPAPAGGGAPDGLGALLALPAAALAVAVLVLDELDEAFANLYSTAVSLQNARPGWDRRVLAVVVGVVATALAVGLGADYASYEAFLLLLGAVFVPLTAVLLVTFFVLRPPWDTSATARGRWALLLPWGAGFAAYQLVAPTAVTHWDGWAAWWTARRADLGIAPPGWLSASLVALVVAAALTLAVGPLVRRR